MIAHLANNTIPSATIPSGRVLCPRQLTTIDDRLDFCQFGPGKTVESAGVRILGEHLISYLQDFIVRMVPLAPSRMVTPICQTYETGKLQLFLENKCLKFNSFNPTLRVICNRGNKNNNIWV